MHTQRTNPSSESGLTMIEMLFAIAGFALLSVGIADQIRLYNERAEAAVIADQVKMIANAGERYIRDNYTAGEDLASQIAPGSPVTVPVGAMSDYLPGGFEARVGLLETPCMMVGQSAANGPLQGVVVTTGGETYNDSKLSRVAVEIGAAGGAIYNNAAAFGAGISGQSYDLSGSTLGAFGFGGSGACPTGTSVSAGAVGLNAGHVAAALEVRPDRFDAGVLYRNAIAGRPELNAMNTDLDMGANDVNDAENVNVNDTLAAGGDVAAGGRIAAVGDIGSVNGDVRAINGDVRASNGVVQTNDVVLEDVTIDDDVITATASAVDTSEEGTFCTEAITYPSAFVRVTGEDLPAATRVTLTNGWGTTAEVDADAPLIDPDTLAGGIQPDGEPPATPAALDCATDGFERHPEYVDDDNVAYGTLTNDSEQPTFALRVRNPDSDASDDLTFERGEEIEFRLHNVSSRYVTTGNKHKYNLQLRTEAGWEEVRGTTAEPNRVPYTDEGISQPPGEGFTWSFELTEDGLLAGHPHEDDLTICPELQAGRYRFAYWGVPDGHLGVQFDYTD